ncbi:MAG: hypothetical protein K9J13_14365 [Saprospiraceae bacterium]|nr:hypothetical protein [Saprospiraceae bacterium]
MKKEILMILNLILLCSNSYAQNDSAIRIVQERYIIDNNGDNSILSEKIILISENIAKTTHTIAGVRISTISKSDSSLVYNIMDKGFGDIIYLKSKYSSDSEARKEFNIKKVKKHRDTKLILDKLCNQVVIETIGKKYIVWYSPELGSGLLNKNFIFQFAEGIPLEIIAETKEETFYWYTKSIEKVKLNGDEFKMPENAVESKD